MSVRLFLQNGVTSSKNGSSESLSNLLLVVPTKRRIRHQTRELLSERQTALSDLNLYTLETLARAIFVHIFAERRIIEEPIQSLLMNQAVDKIWSEMGYFGNEKKRGKLPRGTFEKIASAIKNLKEAGVTPDVLSGELEMDEEDERAKLRDIIQIYSAYESILTSLHGVDIEGLFAAIALDCPQKKFIASFKNLFAGIREISIVGFDEFTEPELAFIQRLCQTGCRVSLEFDFQHGNSPLFGHLEENYRRFRQLGFIPVGPEEGHAEVPGQIELFGSSEDDQPTTNISDYFAQNLFKSGDFVERKDCRNQVTIAKTKDRLSEAELVCKLIKQLIANNPARDLSKICVATYRPQIYSSLLREQAKKFGIPLNVTDRFELSQAPVVVAIIALLEMSARGFRRDDVLRVVASKYFRLENSGLPVNGENLMTISVDLKIVRGVSTWLKKIEELVARAKLEQRMSDDEQENVRRAKDIKRLEKAADDIRWLDLLLRDVSAEQPADSFERTLHQLLERLQLQKQIVSVPKDRYGDLIEKDARAYSRFLEVLSHTKSLLEYQQGITARHNLKFFVDQLKLAISQERYNVRELFGQGVLVTSIEETRGLPIDVMIVAGLVDGEFPSVYHSEIFYSSRRLKERELRHTWENRYLFYQAVSNWTEHLYLTFPQQDADLDLVQSSFVDAMESIIDAEKWEYPGSSPFESTIYSEEDLLRLIGNTIGNNSRRSIDFPAVHTVKTDYIKKAIEVEQSRVDVHNLPAYEGEIFHSLPPELREKLAELKHRVYSVSQLETYGKCPYQFFAQRLLRLSVVEEFEEEFSALEKGSVLHEALFEFYSERRDKNLPALIGCSDTEFSQAYQRLLEITQSKLAQIDIPDAFWDLEKELILGDRTTGHGLLWEFANHERNRSTTFQPAYFEVGFGSRLGAQTRIDRKFSSEDPVVAGSVMLRGKVDRIDVGDGAFSIIDYKTGKSLSKIDDIRTGISLQLPVYLYSIEKLMQEKLSMELLPGGGSYYQIRSPIALKIGVGSERHKKGIGAVGKAGYLPTDAELRSLIDESISLINKFVDNISHGSFPLAALERVDKVCKYCDYKVICRIQTVRQVDKPKGDTT